ncbi:MAG TPA: tetratricopeptide repeat protein [Candidatus Acidoferrales bacterium]|nr:tetratricopeptide repeat protein [Candidatus Acidoferrales bacterium]
MVAALFAIHPLNIETVAWISERKSLLSALFSLLTLGCYGWYVQKRGLYRYLLTAALFALALMAKPMAMTLPVILLLLDYWPLERLSFERKAGAESALFLRKIFPFVLEKAPLFLLSAISASITLIAQARGGSVADSNALPLVVRLKNAAVSGVTYIQKAFWPSRLAVFYPHPGSLLGWSKVAFALVLLILITFTVVRFYRRRYLPVGWFVFLITLLPVIGIVQVGRQAMADRYAYLPLIGIFLIVVWGSAELADRLAIAPSLRAVVAACTLIALALTTRSVLPSWQNSLTLFTRARELAIVPDYQIEGLLGEALDSAGRFEEARQHFETARALNGRDPLARYNIGTYLLREGKPLDAISEFQTALQFSTDRTVTASILNNLGVSYLLSENYVEAVRTYTEALKLDSSHYSSLLGRGQAFYKQQKYHEAADDFARALAIKPQAVAFLWHGKALEGAGQIESAIEAYNETLRLDPGSAEAKNRIAALALKK